MSWIRTILTLAVAAVLALPAPAATTDEDLEAARQRASQLVAEGKYEAAQQEADKLLQSERWMQDADHAVAGTVRAIADELVAAGKPEMAQEIVEGAPKKKGATDAVAVLQGRSLAPFRSFSQRFTGRRVRFTPVTGRLFVPSRDLTSKVFVGHQAGILKILDDANKVLFIKDVPGTDLKGIDGRMWAPLDDHHRQGIRGALGIREGSDDYVAESVLASFDSAPDKLAAIALVGALASNPEGLGDGSRKAINEFLLDQLTNGTDVKLRRQALLGLALAHQIDDSTVARVVDYYDQATNVWEAFPIVQFFEYHSDFISGLPNASELKARIAAMEGLYTPYIVEHIK